MAGGGKTENVTFWVWWSKRKSMNGCLRMVLFYIGSLVAVIIGVLVMGSGALSNLPVIGGATSGITSTGITSTGNTTSLGTGGGPVAPGQGGAAINSRMSASPQGGTLTSWGSPPFYIVQPGDTLAGIATQFGTTPAVLKQYNPGLTDNIYVNQVIFLPPVNGEWLPGTGRNANP
jgi:LysM repeat protein